MIQWIIEQLKKYIESQQPEPVKVPVRKEKDKKPPFMKK